MGHRVPNSTIPPMDLDRLIQRELRDTEIQMGRVIDCLGAWSFENPEFASQIRDVLVELDDLLTEVHRLQGKPRQIDLKFMADSLSGSMQRGRIR